MPKFQSWVSLTPGKTSVDLSQNPVVISTRFDSFNGRLGGLNVVANIFLGSAFISSIYLIDIGTLGNRHRYTCVNQLYSKEKI